LLYFDCRAHALGAHLFYPQELPPRKSLHFGSVVTGNRVDMVDVCVAHSGNPVLMSPFAFLPCSNFSIIIKAVFLSTMIMIAPLLFSPPHYGVYFPIPESLSGIHHW